MARASRVTQPHRQAAKGAKAPRPSEGRAATPKPRRGSRRSGVEEVWGQLFEHIPEPAVVTDAVGRIVAANLAAVRLFAPAERRLAGSPLEELVAEGDRPQVAELVSRLQETNRPVLESRLALRRQGERSVASVVTLVGLRGDGDRLRAIGWVFHYIGRSAQEAEEIQLARGEVSTLRLALDLAAMTLNVDRHGRIREANERCCEFFGFSREALVGCTLAELGLASYLDDHRVELEQSLGRGEIWGGEVEVRAKGDEQRWLQATVIPLIDARGRMPRYLILFQDVTSRRRARDMLVAQAGLARLGAMAAMVAHEVRNPLAAARGAIEVIRERMAADEDQRTLGEVSERLARLGTLVDDILRYARPRPLELVDADLVLLIEAVVDEARDGPLFHGIAIRFERPAEGFPRLRLDASAMRRVLLNLLRNAAQALGGEGHIVVSLALHGARCRLRVRDDGPGIPEDIRAKVFEPFFTTKHEGSGLGLAIARRTVELHGGRLDLITHPDGGAEAQIDLPLSAEA